MATFLEKLWATRAIWDEDEREHGLEQIRRDESTNPSARLVLSIVDQVMKEVRKNFIPSSDNVDAFFPCHYLVFLGPEDEELTKGARLPHIKGRVIEEVFKRLRSKQIDPRRVPETISIEILVDPNAGIGQIRALAQDDPIRSTPLVINSDEERRTEKDLSSSSQILYTLRIYLKGELEREVAVNRAALTIGRGKDADIKLNDIDSRIGRQHCQLILDEELFVVATNDNPIVVNDAKLYKNEKLPITEKDSIQIYGYELKCDLPQSDKS